MSKINNLQNRKFGRLTVIEMTKKRKNRHVIWKCVCDCGNEVFVASNNLLCGQTRSCGCLQRELASKNNTVHGMRKTRIYNSWAHMIDRCNNPNNAHFKDYGGRGISVYKRWYKFENFFADMGEMPDELTLERKNNNGNYEPKNCKWATRLEQQANTRKLKWFRAWHKDMMCQFMSNNQCEFARRYGLEQGCISRCLSNLQRQHKGWTFCLI